jgi:hypothetical protein
VESLFIDIPIGYFLTVELAGRGGNRIEYSVLTRNNRTIQSSSNVVLMWKRG